MKTIKIKLLDNEKRELMLIRQKSGDYRCERALAVLHCADGMRPNQIAKILKRSSQTICSWLHSFKEDGIIGLNKDFSSGRPSIRKEKLIPKLPEYLSKSPRDYGWGEDIWSVKVLGAQFQKDNGFSIGRHSIIRALSDEGFVFKRAKKTVPVKAPTKEEKIQRIHEIAEEISKLKESSNVEVMFLDESHFSTEPYVVKGWSKKGEPFFPSDTNKTRGMHDIWGIRASKRWFLLEKLTEK